MIGRALLAALLGLSLWTAGGRAVDTVLPSPSANAPAAAACVDLPHPGGTEQQPWAAVPGQGAPLSTSAWKSPPRLAAFAIVPAAAPSRVAPNQLARPGPLPAAVTHLHAIPLLI